ncbi:hypothetical protein LTR84_004592 [Exophiala bonariae]|uniref:Protein ARV n=1 Tax=Exophiala bonariae TaxID=1690606 RepID=A0AAV9NQ28_9EURO|nr:hypothetical protein LTR84_004592 [Exophiala bonariae]
MLIKPQVYRHLLFNRLGRSDDKFDPSILRLGTLLVLFDVYITWARIERTSPVKSDNEAGSRLTQMPILTQYLFFLTMNILATVAQHGIIRTLARAFLSPPDNETDESRSPENSVEDGLSQATVVPGHASPNAISTALLVSSCSKLFPILLVIWPTEANEGDPFGFAFQASNYVGWAVLLNNIEALLILLNCGYRIATGLALAGVIARWLVESWILNLMGLGIDTSPIGDVLAALSYARTWLSLDQ